MKAQAFVPGSLVLVPVEQLAALLDERLELALQRQAERQDAARRPLSAEDCAAIYCRKGTPDVKAELARWRDMRHRWPVLDERAAVGPPGKGRRWDAEKLAATFAELRPQMRRRRGQDAP